MERKTARTKLLKDFLGAHTNHIPLPQSLKYMCHVLSQGGNTRQSLSSVWAEMIGQYFCHTCQTEVSEAIALAGFDSCTPEPCKERLFSGWSRYLPAVDVLGEALPGTHCRKGGSLFKKLPTWALRINPSSQASSR